MVRKQTIYKAASGYYKLHKEELLQSGYTITQDTEEFSIFEKQEPSKGSDEDVKAVQNGTKTA